VIALSKPNTLCVAGHESSASPPRDRIERRPIDFGVFRAGNANRTAFGLELRMYNRQFGRKLVRSVGGKLNILEDKTALILILPTNYEIKRVIRHPNVHPLLEYFRESEYWRPDVSPRTAWVDWCAFTARAVVNSDWTCERVPPETQPAQEAAKGFDLDP